MKLLITVFDEALAGYCKHIKISINKDGSLTVEDDGRGMPVDNHPNLEFQRLRLSIQFFTQEVSSAAEDTRYLEDFTV